MYETYLGWHIGHLLKYAGLTKVVKQNDEFFIDLLNKFWVGNINDDVKLLLKTRFIHHLIKRIHKNEPVMKVMNE